MSPCIILSMYYINLFSTTSCLIILIFVIIFYIRSRWFSQWKERHQIHFKFGDWCIMNHDSSSQSQHQHDSSTSDLNTNTNTNNIGFTASSIINTNDLPTVSEENEEEDQHVWKRLKTSTEVNGNSHSSQQTGNEKSILWRPPILDIPKPYSHRFQCIKPSSNSCNTNEIQIYLPPPTDSNTKEWLCIY